MRKRSIEIEYVSSRTRYSRSFVVALGYHCKLVVKAKDRLNDTFMLVMGNKIFNVKRYEFFDFATKRHKNLMLKDV